MNNLNGVIKYILAFFLTLFFTSVLFFSLMNYPNLYTKIYGGKTLIPFEQLLCLLLGLFPLLHLSYIVPLAMFLNSKREIYLRNGVITAGLITFFLTAPCLFLVPTCFTHV